MKSHPFEMSILVDNKPIDEYAHEGSCFVEGRKGSEYTIRLVNNSNRRACFVVSVDGLSVINGEEAKSDSAGYVVDAYRSLDLACFKVDNDSGARFEFGSKEKSYSQEIGKGTANVGVIAAAAFLEKQPEYQVYHHKMIPDVPKYGQPWRQYMSSNSMGSNSSGNLGPKASGGSFHNTATASAASTRSTKSSSARGIVASGASADSFEQEGLGTSFGQSMAWKTHEVTFIRENPDPNATLAIYYDNQSNLKKRGIVLKSKDIPPLPNPFPANAGCPTPPGWKK